MERLVVEIPADLVEEFERYQDRLREVILVGLRQLKVEESLALYRRGVVSIGRAAELAGVSRDEIIRHARAAGIEPRWSEQMVRDELA